jgi:hypothetical protein
MSLTSSNSKGINHVSTVSDPDFEKITEKLDGLDRFAEKAPANVLLKDV